MGLSNPPTIGSYDNAASQLSPDTVLHNAVMSAVKQAPPQPQAPVAQQQPAQTSPQPAQQTPQPAPTPAPANTNAAPQPQQDPWAAFPDAPQAVAKSPANDPWAAFPDAPKQQPQQQDHPMQAWLRQKASEMDKANNQPVDTEGNTDPSMIPAALGSNMRGFADLMDKKPLTLDALSLLSMFVPIGEIAGLTKAAGATPEAAQALKQGFIPKSAGEITQNPDIQRMEEQAGAGLYGGVEGQKAAQDFRANKSNAMQSEISTLGGKIAPVQAGASKADNMGAVANIIQKEAETSKAGVDAAYDAARDANKANPIVVPKQDLSANLGPKLNEVKADFNLGKDVQDTQAADVVLKKLTDKFSGGNEGTASGPNSFTNLAEPPSAAPAKPPTFEDLELWRRNATNTMNNSNSPATKKAIGQMISAYDDYSSQVASRLRGDTQGIQAYKDAVAARAAHGARFENNDMLDNIQHLGEKGYPKSIDDITNDFYGSGAVKGKQGMADNYQALMKAAGTRAPEVQQQLQNGMAQKIYENSIDGKLPGSETAAISPAKLKTQLTNLFVNQRELAKSLFGQASVDHANDLIQELSMSEKQPKVTNPSGTSYMQQHIQKSLTDMLPGWAKLVVNTGKAAFKGGVEAKQAETAAQSFAGKLPKQFQPPAPPTPGILARTAGKTAIKETTPAATGLLNQAKDNDNGPE